MTECRDYDPMYKLHGCELDTGHPGGTPGLHRDFLGNEWYDLLPEEPERCASYIPDGSGYPEDRCVHYILAPHPPQHLDRHGNTWGDEL